MRSILFVLAFCSASLALQNDAVPLRNHDPDAANISVSDVTLFWRAYDRWVKDYGGASGKLPEVLQHEYLDQGSIGVKDFIPHRIGSAENLSSRVLGNRAYYENVRRTTEQLEASLPEIRRGFHELQRLYPDAVFPPVYFVIGAVSSGGTSTDHGLMIGAEMLSDKNPLAPSTDPVAIVMHELIHFQQKHSDSDLLASCLLEGAADFVSELVAGRNINERNKAYGDSHEEELWLKFREDIKRTDKTDDWLYNYRNKARVGPPDLGYYVGYKVSQSLYEISNDKAAALRTIIEMRDPQKVLEMSAYEKRFSAQPVKTNGR
jgi:hypothetical protein